MLKDSFFKVLEQVHVEDSISSTQQKVRFQVALDPAHTIYKGHFPGNPVVPGVCQIEMIRELLGISLDRKMRLIEADNIKYLSMINPLETTQFQVDLDTREKEPGISDVSATISSGIRIFLKFKGTFKVEA